MGRSTPGDPGGDRGDSESGDEDIMSRRRGKSPQQPQALCILESIDQIRSPDPRPATHSSDERCVKAPAYLKSADTTVTPGGQISILGCMSCAPSSSKQTTRSSLLLRLGPGDPGRELAWAEFYALYAPIISGFARRLGASRAEIEDLVQEVLRAFFAASPEFNYDPARGRFRGYLKTCVWHKMSELRRKAGQEPAALGTFPTPDNQSIEDAWNDVWETEKLHRALAAVRERYSNNTERQRTFRAFEMCALLDRPTESVAAALGLSEESVRQAKSRVGKALRETFEHLDSTTG